MDILVEAMHSVRINGALIVETQLWGEWCYQSQEREALRGDPLTAKSVLAFHLVVEGTCVASIPGQPPVQTRAGELLLLPQAEQHILASSMSAFKTLRPREDHYDSLRSTGGELHLSESASTRFVCGYLSCGGDDAVSAFAKPPSSPKAVMCAMTIKLAWLESAIPAPSTSNAWEEFNPLISRV